MTARGPVKLESGTHSGRWRNHAFLNPSGNQTSRFSNRYAFYSSAVLRALFVVVLFIGTGCFRVNAQNIPPGAPPDVQKIMEKMKAGQRPTAEEMQRLQEWATELNTHLNGPSAGGSQFTGLSGDKEQKGIPCRIDVTMSYTAKGVNSTETLHINAWTKAVLFPDVKGTGDYWMNALNPSVPVSSFRIEPYAPGGQIATTGGGGGTMVNTTKAETNSEEFHFAQAAFTGLLVTTGQGDSLFGMSSSDSGGLGGIIEGTRTIKTDDGSRNYALKTNIIGSIAIPLADEGRYDVHPGQPTPTPRMQLSYRAMVDAIKTGTTAAVTGTESFDFERNGTTYQGTSTLTITLHPSALELAIEPMVEAAYEQWLPMPDASESGKEDIYGDPKPIPIHLVMLDTSKAPTGGKSGGPTKPNTEQGTQIDVYLKDVSKIKGVSMNYPEMETIPSPISIFQRNSQRGLTTWTRHTCRPIRPLRQRRLFGWRRGIRGRTARSKPSQLRWGLNPRIIVRGRQPSRCLWTTTTIT